MFPELSTLILGDTFILFLDNASALGQFNPSMPFLTYTIVVV